MKNIFIAIAFFASFSAFASAAKPLKEMSCTSVSSHRDKGPDIPNWSAAFKMKKDSTSGLYNIDYVMYSEGRKVEDASLSDLKCIFDYSLTYPTFYCDPTAETKFKLLGELLDDARAKAVKLENIRSDLRENTQIWKGKLILERAYIAFFNFLDKDNLPLGGGFSIIVHDTDKYECKVMK